MRVAAYATARQPSRSAEPFDAIPLSVQERRDLTGNVKRLYAALSSAQRMNWQPTYAELADRLGSCERSIVRWVARLVEVGLISSRRRGQGLSNILTVVALVRSDSRPTPARTDWPAPTRSRGEPKNPAKNPGTGMPPGGRLTDSRWFGRWT